MSLIARSFASLLLLVCVVTSVRAQTAAPSANPYKITGTVLNSSTGAPVPHCHIVPTKIDRNGAVPRRTVSPQDGATTDDRGHFALSLPSAGSWALLARAPGYRAQTFDQHEGFSSSIVLTEENPSYDLVFRLAPDSAISGIIRDEGNEPVRQAQVQVFAVSHAGADGERAPVSRGSASTDDRGHYEVGGLAPGDYRVSVQAHAWYATLSQSARSPGASQLDPALDVVYPLTWYPGVSDGSAAQTVTLHDGESRQADVQLLPIPAFHLRIPVPTPDPIGLQNGVRRPMRYPQVTSASGNNFLSLSSSTNAQGELEISGLAPGLYRVQTPEENGQPGHSTLVEISANSSHTLDLAAAANTATVELKIEGDSDAESLPLAFVDVSNERNVFRSNPNREGGRSPIRRNPAGALPRSVGRPVPMAEVSPQQASSTEQSVRTLELPPGRYSVFQNGSANHFLSGLTQGRKDIPGRVVTIPSGSSSLTVHIATGRATVNGIATLGGKPVVGALVLLVPITVGQPGSIPELRRDQTNTDGSFDLDLVIPGQYILIAIDHGWDVRWEDSSTLNHYLLKGIPLDLRTPSPLKQNIEAQIP